MQKKDGLRNVDGTILAERSAEKNGGKEQRFQQSSSSPAKREMKGNTMERKQDTGLKQPRSPARPRCFRSAAMAIMEIEEEQAIKKRSARKCRRFWRPSPLWSGQGKSGRIEGSVAGADLGMEVCQSRPETVGGNKSRGEISMQRTGEISKDKMSL